MECIQLIEEITGIKADVKYSPKRTGDLWYFVCDITKAKENLRWSPKISNREGVGKLAAWVAENKAIFGGVNP